MTIVKRPKDQLLFEGVQIVFGAVRPPSHSPQRSNPAGPNLGKDFDEALAFASDLHREQRRKGTAIPYVTHLLAVCSLALEMGADEDQAIAALLHDAVEDQGGAPRLFEIRARFGERVARIVADCSDWDGAGTRPQWRERKQAYLDGLATKPADSLLVVLADKTHNARAIVDDFATHGAALWDRFNAGRAEVLWYYGALAEAFSRSLPGAGAARLGKLVEQMAGLE